MPKMKNTRKNLQKINHVPCAYSHYDKKGIRIRIGSTRDCKARLTGHFGKIKAKYFSKKETRTASEARSIEKSICERENPRLNSRC